VDIGQIHRGRYEKSGEDRHREMHIPELSNPGRGEKDVFRLNVMMNNIVRMN
jgi:hypothetical protein